MQYGIKANAIEISHKMDTQSLKNTALHYFISKHYRHQNNNNIILGIKIMGKLKHDSDDDMGMDIELPIPTTKKNKLISKKSRPESTARSSTASTKSSKSVVRQFAKSVNLKNKLKPLDQKQAIFNKVVDGLKDKTGVSKKNKKKMRVEMKKVILF